jgi:hypothetical protein
LQQRGVDEAEDGSVCADAEGERQNRRECETGLLAQHARGVAQVLPQISAEKRPRCAGRDRRRHMRLAQRPHLVREHLGLAQFFDRETPRVGLTGAIGSELVIPLIEML